MDKRFFFALSTFALTLVYAALYWQYSSQVAATEAGYERICPGMTELQVEHLLGGRAELTVPDQDLENKRWAQHDREYWVAIAPSRTVVRKWRADKVAGGTKVRS